MRTPLAYLRTIAPSALGGRSLCALAGCCLLVALLLGGGLSSPAWGQERGGRVFEGEAFDRITLDAKNDNAVIRVRPIPFPNRQVPAKPKPSDKLKVRLLEDGKEYELAWFNIAKLELFEQVVLSEAQALTTAGKLDEAFDYFAFLLDRYPKTPGFEEARQQYLYLGAGQAFRQKQFDEALALLEELHSQNPEFRSSASGPTVLQIVGSTADNLIGGYIAKDDYRSARNLLERLIKTYRAANEPFAQKWTTQLQELATVEKNRAETLLEQSKFVEAYDATARMKQIWPNVTGGQELLAEMAQRYPMFSVGVTHSARSFDARSMVDPAARRTGRLLQRQLSEFAEMGPEGGKYTSPFGEIVHSDDGTSFSLEMNPSETEQTGLSAFEVARRLLQLADKNEPDYQPAWTRLVSAVQVKQAQVVQIDLRTPHVLPEALLQVPVMRAPAKSKEADPFGPFHLMASAGTSRFVRNDRSPFLAAGQPAEIVERVYDDPQRQLLALKRGEIDVIDQVFPGDLSTVRLDSQLAAVQYTAPTSHFLLINRNFPYLANRTFRRALLYATDRQAILYQGLMKGQDLPGWRVVSGPFPAAPNLGDNLAYGYDEEVIPRPYDPRLALVLKALAQRELKIVAEKTKEQPPAWRPLVLGHPADELSRIACRALVKQWKIVGIEVKLQEFPAGAYLDPQQRCDLTYVQAATWEPIVDASRLFGAEGLTPTDNAFIRLAIKQIEGSTNWQQVRQRMKQLHQLVHEDVAVLPLWQTYDYYAFRRGIPALESGRVSLYQNVQEWRADTKLATN
jgi:tetratricopeptide (TPR) repeat protein